MNLCAATLPPGENELLHSGLTAVPSSVVKPPRIAEAPVSFECRSHSIIEIGDNRLIIGEVLRVPVYTRGDEPVARRKWSASTIALAMVRHRLTWPRPKESWL